ncbi:MAG: permease, partial [Candidatus Omnitrophota bacterium]
VLAIILTARILGWQLGLARAVGAVVFSFVIGLSMHFIFYKEECRRQECGDFNKADVKESRSLGRTILYFASMVAVLVFANWGNPLTGDQGIGALIYRFKWWISGASLVSLAVMLVKWFKKEELIEWTQSTWGFALQILPLLLGGVLVSGFVLGRVGHEGVIPAKFVVMLVGGNSLSANFFSAIVAAFMYFATLTEVPILQGLMNAGMGKGPALALLLAGPALSLPSMLVLRGIMGTKKTVVYVSLVVAMATISGVIFGWIVK